MAGNTANEAAAIGRQIRGAKQAEPYSFAFAIGKATADSAMAVDKSKAPNALEGEVKRASGSGAKVFSGQVYMDGSKAVFASDDAPSSGEKSINDWFKQHKVSLSASVTKALAQASEDEEEEEGPKIYATETLIARFRFAMRNPVNFAFGPGKTADDGLLALHVRRGGQLLFRNLRRENQSVRGSWGVLEMDGRVANFRCDDTPIPGLRKRIRAFLLSRNLRFRVKIFGPEGEVVEPGDEEEDLQDQQAEQGQPQEGQPAQPQQSESAQPQQAEPAQPQQAEEAAQPEGQATPPPPDDGIGTDAQRLEEMRGQMQRMLDPLKEIAQKVPSRNGPIRDLYGQFDAAQKQGNVSAAQTALDGLREQGRTGRADMQALATMRERLDGMLPQLQQLFQAKPDEADYIRTMWRQCDSALKAGNVTEAREAIFELATITRAPVKPSEDGAPGEGTTRFRQILLRWKGAQNTLESNVEELGRTMLADARVQADPRFGEVQAQVGELTQLLPAWGDELQDAVDEIINAGPEAKEQDLFRPAIAVVDDYLKELAGHPELEGLENLAAMLGSSLKFDTVLRESLREIRATLSAAA